MLTGTNVTAKNSSNRKPAVVMLADTITTEKNSAQTKLSIYTAKYDQYRNVGSIALKTFIRINIQRYFINYINRKSVFPELLNPLWQWIRRPLPAAVAMAPAGITTACCGNGRTLFYLFDRRGYRKLAGVIECILCKE